MMGVMKEPMHFLCSTLEKLLQAKKTTYEASWTAYQFSMALEKVFYYLLWIIPTSFKVFTFDNDKYSFCQFFYGQVGHFNSHIDHIYAVNLGPGHRYLSRCVTDWKGMY